MSSLPNELVPEDHQNLALALEMGQRSLKTGGVPIGAVLSVPPASVELINPSQLSGPHS